MLSDRIRALMKERGFSKLTPIQEIAIPAVASGLDTLVIAPTGYGKTEAAMLPLLDKMQQSESKPIELLYITPLRALNRDMLTRLFWWCEKLGLSISVRHGDTKQSERAKQAKKPSRILLTTPETLQAILPAKKIGKALENVRYVVIDEVHELFTSKRGAQLTIALERLRLKAKKFQTIGISATISDEKEVAQFIFSGDHEIASSGKERKYLLDLEHPLPRVEDEELSNTLFLESNAICRLRRLNELIQKKKTLVFVNTRSVAETLSSRLLAMKAKIAVHHGSLARDVRINTEERFKNNEIQGLISTSSLELGIDIGDIEQVVQYLSPRQVIRLVQRVGRSGHSIEKMPSGIVIASELDDLLESIVIVRRAHARLLEKGKHFKKPLDVLAHQIAGLLLEYGALEIEKILEIVRKAYPFRDATLQEITDVINQLNNQRIIVFRGRIAEKRKATLLYYYENLSMIPAEKKFSVRNSVTNSIISTLDEGFIVTLEKGEVFISRGLPWRILDIHEQEVLVEPSENIAGAIPDWEGEEIPVSFEVAQEVGRLRERIVKEEIGQLAKEYNLNVQIFESLRNILKQQVVMPTDKVILVESIENLVLMHSCLGSLGNETLARAVASTLTLRLGSSVKTRVDPYRILVELPRPVDANRIKDVMLSLQNLESLIERNIVNSSLFKYKLTHQARTFGFIGKENVLTQRIRGFLVDTIIHREAVKEIFHTYLDLDTCNSFLSKLRSNECRIQTIIANEPTVLGKQGLLKIRASELISPIEPHSEILKAFKKSVLDKRARFVCTYCKKIFYRNIVKLGKVITCEYCNSSLVALVDTQKQVTILQKKKEKLTNEEKKEYYGLQRIASLINAYGKNAVIAMNVYGVGTETAARVLQRLHRQEDAFFIDLLEAQKQFIRTKRYWKV